MRPPDTNIFGIVLTSVILEYNMATSEQVTGTESQPEMTVRFSNMGIFGIGSTSGSRLEIYKVILEAKNTTSG